MNKNIKTWQERADITRKPEGVVERAMCTEIAELRAELEARTPATTDLDERYEFERHMSNEGEAVDYLGDGLYSSGHVQDRWDTWKASAALRPPAAPVVAEGLTSYSHSEIMGVMVPNSPREATRQRYYKVEDVGALLAAHPVAGSPVELDGCKFCLGAKGGVPGNANIIGGERVCDYCTSLWMKIRDAEKAEPMPASEAANGLHAAIMNLPCKVATADIRGTSDAEIRSYQYGHRDARHAAAELVSTNLAAPAAPTDAKDQQLTFEALAEREGLSLTSAPNMKCDDDRFPATYWHPQTESAWRAWANKPNPAAQSVRDAARYQLLRSIGGKSWTRTGTTDRVVGAEYDALVDAERALIQSPQPGEA